MARVYKKRSKKSKKGNPDGKNPTQYWSFTDDGRKVDDEIIARIRFIDSQLRFAGINLSLTAKRKIALHLNTINEIIARELLKNAP